MKLSQFLCKFSIVCLLSSSAIANVSMANMPSNEASIYVQLMSLKSTTLDELADDFETLNQKGYKICTKRTERWHQIFVGPYTNTDIAMADLAQLLTDYADAFMVTVKACTELMDQSTLLAKTIAHAHAQTHSHAPPPPPPPPPPLNKLSSASETMLMAHGTATAANTTMVQNTAVAIAPSIKPPAAFYFNAYKGEAIRHALNRFAQVQGYDRVVIDINTAGLKLDQITALVNSHIKVPFLVDLNFAALYQHVPPSGLHLHSVDEASQRSLVVTDQVYREHQKITIFNVEPGSLLTNIKRLSHHYGWTLAQGGWQLPIDYQVKFAYPLLVHDLFGGLVKLLQRHPVQAQMMQHSKQLAFVARPLLTRNPSQ